MIFFRDSDRSIDLRTVEHGDLADVAKLRNEPSTWSQLTDPIPVTDKDQEAWFSSISLRAGRFWAIACNKASPFIGLVRMDERDTQNRSLRVGLDVVPKMRGCGYGTAIYETLLSYSFRELNVHRLWLQVLETNERAIRLYEKLGFRREGTLRDAVFRNGAYVGYVVMSMLEQEYRP